MKYLVLITMSLGLIGCASNPRSCWDLDNFMERAKCVERERDMRHFQDSGWRYNFRRPGNLF